MLVGGGSNYLCLPEEAQWKNHSSVDAITGWLNALSTTSLEAKPISSQMLTAAVDSFIFTQFHALSATYHSDLPP